MILGAAQIASYALAAGFRGAALATMVAICLAESGGDTQAVSGTADYGIVQIHLASHPDVTMACALDPSCALGKAYQISGGGADFSPWSTYTSGAYRLYLTQAQQAAGQAGQTAGVPVAAAQASPDGGFFASLPPWWGWAALVVAAIAVS